MCNGAVEENTWIVSERLSFVGAMCGGAGVNTESAIRAMVAPRSGHEGGEKSSAGRRAVNSGV